MYKESSRSLYGNWETWQSHSFLPLCWLWANHHPTSYIRWKVKKSNGWRNQNYCEEWHLGTCYSSQRSQCNWCEWVYKMKINDKREIERHKARLLTKGYSKKANIDYDEIFALVA